MMQTFSFYYRDSLDLKSLFPQACRFSLLYPDKDDNVIIEDGKMRLKNPEAFEPSRIHNIVRVYKHKYDYFKINVSIRCWQEGEYSLKEVTRLGFVKASGLYHLCRRLVNKIHPLSFNTHLLTTGKTSYFSRNGFLIKQKGVDRIVIGKMPRLLHPRFYDFVIAGDEAFLRTAGNIYMSRHLMTEWKLIYDGKRAIKDSMIWIEEEQALLFMEYTSGHSYSRHHILKYYAITGETKTIMTFHTPEEHEKEGLTPFCRHIHVLMKDPYSKDIYLGTGDSDEENAIFRSKDNGNTFFKLGGGSQAWRTLSFLFTNKEVFWNTDSPDPQYLSSIRRIDIPDESIPESSVTRWPFFNSASWNSFYDENNDMYIMAANCEGALYDMKYRVYGIRIENGIPSTYCLFEEQAENREFNQFHQLFVLGKDVDGRYWFFDERNNYYRQFVLVK